MLLAGSDDGVYAIDGVKDSDGTAAERVLAADRIYRVGRLPGRDGIFATGASGLYHSDVGREWTRLPLPEDEVYAAATSPDGTRLFAGTRPARVFATDVADGLPASADDWAALDGFAALREAGDWGLERHDWIAQVRSLQTHPDAPDRLVAGVEVGGVHVSDDGGETWEPRTITGFDAPHTDDVHHLAMPGPETFLVSTGSGLFYSTDAGRTWSRLDTGHRQRYFREAMVQNGTVYAGAAPGSSTSWEDDPDHALFEAHAGEPLERVDSPTPAEVALGWCVVDGDPLAATHRGTLLWRRDGEWAAVGDVPTPGEVRGRYLPLAWLER